MIFEWKAYQDVCIVAAGQYGREYRITIIDPGKWSAEVCEPDTAESIRMGAKISDRIVLENGIGLEDAIQVCKLYEIKKVLDKSREHHKTQSQDTTEQE